jgi:hypothetical protein
MKIGRSRFGIGKIQNKIIIFDGHSENNQQNQVIWKM